MLCARKQIAPFMNKNLIPASALAVFLSCASLAPAFGEDAPAKNNTTSEIATAAQKFLATLDETQRGKAVYDFKDSEQRKRWSNLPTTFVKRGGLRMGDLSEPQRKAVKALLAAALSPEGYEKVTEIVEADEILRTTDRGGGPRPGGPGGGGPGGPGRPAAPAAAVRPCLAATTIMFRSSASLPPPSHG